MLRSKLVFMEDVKKYICTLQDFFALNAGSDESYCFCQLSGKSASGGDVPMRRERVYGSGGVFWLRL